MRWTSQISTSERLRDALEEVADAVCEELGNEQPQLVLIFVSGHHRADYADLPDMVRARFPDAVLLGCSGGGIIGAAREVEGSPALSLCAAVLPDVAIVAMLRISSLHGCSRIWCSIVVVIFIRNDVDWWNCCEDWRNAFHILTKAHIEVPFVLYVEWLYSVGHGMIW